MRKKLYFFRKVHLSKDIQGFFDTIYYKRNSPEQDIKNTLKASPHLSNVKYYAEKKNKNDSHVPLFSESHRLICHTIPLSEVPRSIYRL